MTAVAAGAPLQRIVAARSGGFGLSVCEGPLDGPGWRHGDAIATDAALREDLLDRARRAAGTDMTALAVAWIVEKHAWHVASIVVAALLLDGTLPPLRRVQLLYGESGWPDAIAVPASGWEHADAADAARALDDHLAPVIAALGSRRAPRALWREAGDRIGQAALWCGEAFGAREHAWSIGAQLLVAPTRLRAPGQFRLRDGEPFRLRSGCCLAHRAPGGAACADCRLSARSRIDGRTGEQPVS